MYVHIYVIFNFYIKNIFSEDMLKAVFDIMFQMQLKNINRKKITCFSVYIVVVVLTADRLLLCCVAVYLVAHYVFQLPTRNVVNSWGFICCRL